MPHSRTSRNNAWPPPPLAFQRSSHATVDATITDASRFSITRYSVPAARIPTRVSSRRLHFLATNAYGYILPRGRNDRWFCRAVTRLSTTCFASRAKPTSDRGYGRHSPRVPFMTNDAALPVPLLYAAYRRRCSRLPPLHTLHTPDFSVARHGYYSLLPYL